MALQSKYHRREHEHVDRLNGGYFGKLLVFKLSSLNFKLEYTSGISGVQGSI